MTAEMRRAAWRGLDGRAVARRDQGAGADAPQAESEPAPPPRSETTPAPGRADDEPNPA